MSKIRTALAFLGGVAIAFVMGLVPTEMIGRLRDSGTGGTDYGDEPSRQSALTGRQRRRHRR